MKTAIGFMTGILMISGLAQAGTVCGLTGSSVDKPTEFNRNLASKKLEGDGTLSYVLDANANNAVEVDLATITWDQWKALDGQTIVWIEVKADQANYFVSKVEISKTENMLQLQGAVTGGLAKSKPLFSMNVSQKLAIVCTQY